MAAECTCTEREFGRCARPTVRPGRTVHDERNHGDGSDTRPRGRRTSGSLTETRVHDWQYWPARFDGSADRHMNPGPLDGTDQQARTVLAACIESDGPVDADGDQALVIDDARHPAVLPGGEAERPWDAATRARVRWPRRRRCSWPPSPMIPTWPGGSTVSRPSLGSSHRGREQPPARRPRVVIEKRAQSQPAPAAAGGTRCGTDAPICQDSRSRSQVCGLARSVVCHHALKNLAGEKACETADDLPFGPPFSGASFDVVEGW